MSLTHRGHVERLENLEEMLVLVYFLFKKEVGGEEGGGMRDKGKSWIIVSPGGKNVRVNY